MGSLWAHTGAIGCVVLIQKHTDKERKKHKNRKFINSFPCTQWHHMHVGVNGLPISPYRGLIHVHVRTRCYTLVHGFCFFRLFLIGGKELMLECWPCESTCVQASASIALLCMVQARAGVCGEGLGEGEEGGEGGGGERKLFWLWIATSDIVSSRGKILSGGSHWYIRCMPSLK